MVSGLGGGDEFGIIDLPLPFAADDAEHAEAGEREESNNQPVHTLVSADADGGVSGSAGGPFLVGQTRCH